MDAGAGNVTLLFFNVGSNERWMAIVLDMLVERAVVVLGGDTTKAFVKGRPFREAIKSMATTNVEALHENLIMTLKADQPKKLSNALKGERNM